MDRKRRMVIDDETIEMVTIVFDGDELAVDYEDVPELMKLLAEWCREFTQTDTT